MNCGPTEFLKEEFLEIPVDYNRLLPGYVSCLSVFSSSCDSRSFFFVLSSSCCMISVASLKLRSFSQNLFFSPSSNATRSLCSYSDTNNNNKFISHFKLHTQHSFPLTNSLLESMSNLCEIFYGLLQLHLLDHLRCEFLLQFLLVLRCHCCIFKLRLNLTNRLAPNTSRIPQENI